MAQRPTLADRFRRFFSPGTRSRANTGDESRPNPQPEPRPDAVTVAYRPERDGEPDPGEVVWGWVPFEEDPSRGKDRPVLVLAKDGSHWLCLMLTSKDHDRDASREAAAQRFWMDVGTGGWDSQRRPSEVRLDRLIRIPDDAIRREGAALPAEVFGRVVTRAQRFHDLVWDAEQGGNQ